MAQPAPLPPWVCYDGAPPPPGWRLDETPVPESTPHDAAVRLLFALLEAWAARTGGAARVARNLALCWHEPDPRVGLDPDVALYEPAPPGFDDLTSVRTWLPEHAPPKVAVEVVSPGHLSKDYDEAPLRYAASGAGELWVFDPLLAGPEARGGPHRVQVWARAPRGRFERAYAGGGPARSPYLAAYLVPVEGGRLLRLSDDAGGQRPWPTGEEAERAAKGAERRAREAAQAQAQAERRAREVAEAQAQAERRAREAAQAQAEAERRAKDDALAELAQLRAELAARREGKAP